MPVQTISLFDTVTDSADAPVANATVTLTFGYNSATTADGLLQPSQRTVQTDGTGKFTFAKVIPVDLISPANTVFVIETPFRVYEVAPQSGNGASQQSTAANVIVNNPLALAPYTLIGPVSVTGTLAVTGALTVASNTGMQVDALGNISGRSLSLSSIGPYASTFPMASGITSGIDSPVYDKGGQVFNFKNPAYGGNGNGVFDNAAKLNSFLGLVPQGTNVTSTQVTLYAPAGDYVVKSRITSPQSASNFTFAGDGMRATQFDWRATAADEFVELLNPHFVSFHDLGFFCNLNNANVPIDGIRVHRTTDVVFNGSGGFTPAVTGMRLHRVFIGGDIQGGSFWSMVNGLQFLNDGALLNNEQATIDDCTIVNTSQYGVWFNGADSRQHNIIGGQVGDSNTAAISNVATGGAQGGSFVVVGTNVYAGKTSGTVGACFELGGAFNPCVMIGPKCEGPSVNFINTPNQITIQPNNHHYVYGAYYSGANGAVLNFNSTGAGLHLTHCGFTTPIVATYNFAGTGSTVEFTDCAMNASTVTFNNELSFISCFGISGSTTFTNSGSGRLRMRECKGGFEQYNTANNDGDRGNNSITLTPGADREVQLFNTPLTTNRTVTLSTSNARSGDRFRIVRMSGATGNFALSVGNVNMALSQWTEWIYSSTFGGWQKTASGSLLPPNFIVASEASVVAGQDVSGVGSISVTLSAARLIASFTNALQGQRVSITLIQSGAGAFAVTWNAAFKVSWSDVGNATSKRSTIAFVWDGTNWNQDGAQTPYV